MYEASNEVNDKLAQEMNDLAAQNGMFIHSKTFLRGYAPASMTTELEYVRLLQVRELTGEWGQQAGTHWTDDGVLFDAYHVGQLKFDRSADEEAVLLNKVIDYLRSISKPEK